MSFALFNDLDSDWCAVATSQGARDALERWADDPILDGARALDDVLAHTARGGDPRDADAVLRALLSRANSDDIAARTVLQAIVPGLVTVASRVGARENPDLEAEVATVTWSAIRDAKLLGRRGSIAGQLLLDVFHVVSRLRRGEQEQPVPPEDPARFVPTPDEHGAPVPTGESSSSSSPVPGKSPQTNCVSSANGPGPHPGIRRRPPSRAVGQGHDPST